MTLHHEEDEGGGFAALPVNKPRHVVFTDEFIGKIIRAFRVLEINLKTPEEEEPSVHVVGFDPNAGSSTRVEFKGSGPTVGHALRDCLDHINEIYPLGGEYQEGPPDAA